MSQQSVIFRTVSSLQGTQTLMLTLLLLLSVQMSGGVALIAPCSLAFV